MLGRKMSIIVGSVIMIVGATIQCASFSLPQLIVSRLITGFGNGQFASSFHGLLAARLEDTPGMNAPHTSCRNQHLDGAHLAV